MLKCICKNNQLNIKFIYSKKPNLETNFNINPRSYHRKFLECNKCGHLLGDHNYDLEKIYSKLYVEKTYGNKLHENFLKIINLPKKKSDNYWRLKRIVNFSKKYFNKKDLKKIKLLDIGSGTGVFPYTANKTFQTFALDPDKKNINHLKKLKINTIKGFYKTNITKKKFNIITLNKIIEHVKNPKKIIENLKYNLSKTNFIYIEVPDGFSAKKSGKNREEFYIEHYHAFSPESLNILCAECNLKKIKVEKIIEPSGKYTIYGFFTFS